ncbi:RHS repeat domain-containing protein [Lysobacter soli]|uniref:RHS repeat domain-containing protein n=1 Tax=Lysobacter soli TaxID=453783 RepID=UPI0037C8EB23
MARIAGVVLLWLLCCMPAMAQSFGVTIDAVYGNYVAPGTITISASADGEDGARISSIKIFQNGVQIAGNPGADITHTIYNVPAGTYEFQAKATGKIGTVSSQKVIVTVIAPGANPPTVSINPPTGLFIGPANVGLSANAVDSDGYITRVEFYANGVHVGTDDTAPYAMTWSGVAVGSYTLGAKAYDNNGIGVMSSGVALTVEQSRVIGAIERVSLDPDGTYYVSGWACSTGRNAPIDIQLYVGGAWPAGTAVGTYQANQPSEAAIAATCRAQGTQYRFRTALTQAIRQAYSNQKIYIHGVSPAGAPNDLLADSGVFSVPGPLTATRRYVYDSNQQLCKLIEPETGATVYAYDNAGNLSWSAAGLNLPSTTSCDLAVARDSGRRVDRTYSSRNRLSTLAFPDGNGNQSWNYTPDGLPLNVTTYNDGGATSVVNAYGYNKRRLLVDESAQQTGYTWTMGYGYDGNGTVASISHPDGEVVTFAPNALGQTRQAVSQFGTYASGASYYPNGALKQFTYGNGIVHTLVQNTRGLPDRSLDAYGGVAVLDDSYDYDANGNVAAISDGLPGNRGNRDMIYDGLDRLRTATSPMFGSDPLMEYSYDGLDNLKRVKGGGKDRTYLYDGANRLTNVVNTFGGATVIGLGYDGQGNLANKNGQTYSFDYGNRLRYSSGQENYRYDANGRRVSAFTPTPDPIEIRSFYDSSGVLRYQQDFRRSKVFNYVYLAGSLVGQRETPIGTAESVLKLQHTDALGSPVATTNVNRVVVERSEYAPFGALLNRPITNGPGYTGHVMDAVTGMTYMQQRYYDPTIGRFVSVDPVTADGNTGGNFNRYWYANNNPFRFTDPDGRVSDEPARQPRDFRSMASRASLASGAGAVASARTSRSTSSSQATTSKSAPNSSSSASSPNSPKSTSAGFYGEVFEPNTEVEAVAAYGAGVRYKRDVATGKDSAGMVLLGVGAHGKAASAATLPSVDVLKGGYAWGVADAPVDIEFNGKAFGVGLNINFDPASKIEGSLNYAPVSVGSYTGVSVMFDDTLVGD